MMPANFQVTDEMVENAALAVSKARAHLTGSSSGVILPSDHLYATEALTAALADHVVVPREPTWEMNFAGSQIGDHPWDGQKPSRIYRAMIGAV